MDVTDSEAFFGQMLHGLRDQGLTQLVLVALGDSLNVMEEASFVSQFMSFNPYI